MYQNRYVVKTTEFHRQKTAQAADLCQVEPRLQHVAMFTNKIKIFPVSRQIIVRLQHIVCKCMILEVSTEEN